MKNFLRYIAIIFLIVMVVTIFRGLTGSDTTPLVPETTPLDEEEISDESASDGEEDSLEDVVAPSEEDEGIIMLGGDGIPNN